MSRQAAFALGLLCAALAPALVAAPFIGPSFAVAAVLTALGHAVLLGLPLAILGTRWKLISAATTLPFGFLVGASPAATLLLPNHGEQGGELAIDGKVLVRNGVQTPAGRLDYASEVGLAGLFGATGGLASRLVWRQARPRADEAAGLAAVAEAER